MKLVAVSVVKNEADIIEAFVRHTSTWVDRHLIFDHDSTDGTRQILFALVQEGLPLELHGGDAVGNLQQARSNHLARQAFSQCGADWVLPLDADEILVAADRSALESALRAGPADQPASVLLRNYSPSTADDPGELNPVLRLRHRQRGAASTSKIFIPRALGLQADVIAGKGNHALYRGSQPIADRPLADVSLAHFALRSPHQQVLRVITAELQKLSRGKAHEGLDTHYRLGFQLLAEDADLFFSTVLQPPERLRLDPVPYLGGALTQSSEISAFARSARALVPFLEKLARSHGRLADAYLDVSARSEEETIVPLVASPAASSRAIGHIPFSGFQPVSGWQPEEGPIPEAFLPRFHWATAPETVFTVRSESDRTGELHAQVLSYAENQIATVELNGVQLHRQAFPRVNQKEALTVSLPLVAGDNTLVIRHATWIESPADPRKLALIVLSLRVQ